MKTNLFVALATMIFFCAPTLQAGTLKNSVYHKSFSLKAHRKIDILFVVDNSGSMEKAQSKLLQTIPEFINKLNQAGVDYHIAVTGTDAWRAHYQSASTNIDILSRFRPGPINFSSNPYSYLSNTGIYVVNSQTPHLESVLLTNLNQGVYGTGDERAFESLKAVLDYSANTDFRRADAELSVLIISDEDDFSANTSVFVSGDYKDESTSEPVDLQPNTDPQSTYALYQDARLTPVSEFQTFLDQKAGAGNYSVNVIGVLDVACKVQLNSSIAGSRIGRRYRQLVNASQGFAGSICAFENAMDAYASTLTVSHSPDSYDIQLSRDPLPGTLVVKINGRLINEDAVNGWSLDHQTLILTLHGDSVPQKDDIVSITYDFHPEE